MAVKMRKILARPRQSSGNASEQKFTRNVLLIDSTVRLTTKSQKSAYEEAKIIQDYINVKSSGKNNKLRHLPRKRKKPRKRRKRRAKKLHSELNSLKKLKKSTTH